MSKHVFGHYDTPEEAKLAVDALIASGHKRENITVLADHVLDETFTDFYTYKLVEMNRIEGWDASAMHAHGLNPKTQHYEVPVSAWMRLRDAAIYDRNRSKSFFDKLREEEEKILLIYSKAVAKGEILVVVDQPD